MLVLVALFTNSLKFKKRRELEIKNLVVLLLDTSLQSC
jgi:hypothetical protein